MLLRNNVGISLRTRHWREVKKTSSAAKRARTFLPGDGEQVELLLQALGDFHYRSLTLTVTKSAVHDVQAKLSVLGHNPQVANGRDFQLNVNLETNIGSLLKALAGSYRLSSRTFKRLWQPSQ